MWAPDLLDVVAQVHVKASGILGRKFQVLYLFQKDYLVNCYQYFQKVSSDLLLLIVFGQ